MSNKITQDGIEIVLPTLFGENCQYVIVGRGDDPTLGRGKGTPMLFNQDPAVVSGAVAPQTFTLQWSLNDWALFAGGTVCYDGAVCGDTLDLTVVAPASTVTAAVGATGNCNLVALSSTINAIVPAASNGAYNLATFSPVPAYDKSPLLNYNGQWEWMDAQVATSLVSPSPDTALPPNSGPGTMVPTATAGTGSFMLLTQDVVVEHFMMSMQLNGSHTIKISPQIKPKRICPQWKFNASLYNSGHNGLRLTFFLELARVYTT